MAAALRRFCLRDRRTLCRWRLTFCLLLLRAMVSPLDLFEEGHAGRLLETVHQFWKRCSVVLGVGMR